MNLEGLEGASYTTATYDGDFKQDEEGTEKRDVDGIEKYSGSIVNQLTGDAYHVR